jgi:hypothetical protein
VENVRQATQAFVTEFFGCSRFLGRVLEKHRKTKLFENNLVKLFLDIIAIFLNNLVKLFFGYLQKGLIV